MKHVTRNEELILLSVLNLGEDAYLIRIKNHLSRLTDKKISLNSIHLPLRRLEDAGFLKSHFGGATAVRGGRRKKLYKLTESGIEELTKHKKINDVLWENFTDLASNIMATD